MGDSYRAWTADIERAANDARLAEAEFEDARAWLEEERKGPMNPISAEVWPIDAAFEQILVRHRWRGWVPPG